MEEAISAPIPATSAPITTQEEQQKLTEEETEEAEEATTDQTPDDEENGASPVTPASVSSPSPPLSPPSGRAEEDRRYNYDLGTILAVIQFRPEAEEGQPREVWVSVNNGVGNREDFPLIRFTTATQWQEVLDTLLDELKRDLPRRKLLHEQRKTHKPTAASGGTVVRPTASPAARKAAAPAAAMPAAPPPVPTTSSPIAKQDLAMPGLFDDL